MLYRFSLLLFLLALMAGLSAAQEEETLLPAEIRSPVVIEEVLRQGSQLILRGYAQDGCEFPLVAEAQPTLTPGVFYYQVYRLVDIAAACLAVIQPIEVTIDLPADAGEAIVAGANGIIMSFTDDAGQALELQPLSVSAGQMLVLESFPPQYRLQLTIFTDGCDLPLVVAGEPAPEEFSLRYQLWRAAAPDTACPMIAREIEVVLPLPDGLSGPQLIRVNDFELVYDFTRGALLDETNARIVDSVVDSLVIESPTEIFITGMHMDGCPVPVQIRQEIGDAKIRVHVFRTVPLDMVCTMNLQFFVRRITLEQEILPGMVVEVNKIAVTHQ